ncbi:MAG: hypothetical protein QG658_461 [Patescibacteria group bacterium]|nr:hypothetical protein [Patescibacteria group bacterium]
MITLLVALNVLDEGERTYVRHYEDLPWPRLPSLGDTVDLGRAADIFTETDVPVISVAFHPTNGNVVIELESVEIRPSELDCLYQLGDCGFTEADDPFREYGREPLSTADGGPDNHQCTYREALEAIDALDPNNFQQGQEHLTRAFREPNITAAFREVIRIVNGVLHNKDEYGQPLS